MGKAAKMTDVQALAEARQRWGTAGKVWHHPRDPKPYKVGHAGMRVVYCGAGESWEEAFTDADQYARNW